MPIRKPGEGKRTKRDRLIARVGVFLVVTVGGAALGGAPLAVGPCFVIVSSGHTLGLWSTDTTGATKRRFVIGAGVGGAAGLVFAWGADRAVNRG